MTKIYIEDLPEDTQLNFYAWVLDDKNFYDFIQTDSKGNEYFILLDLKLEAEEKNYDTLLNAFYNEVKTYTINFT